jgi:integrase
MLSASMKLVQSALKESAPHRVLELFKRKKSLRILTRLIEQSVEVTHESLTTFGTPQETLPMRSFLIDAGVLLPRDEYLAQLEVWVAATAEQVEGALERSAFLQYARWKHLRRLREQDGHMTYGQTAGPKAELRHIEQLYEWLRERGIRLKNLDQHVLDRWLAEGPETRKRVKHFLRWARTNRLIDRNLIVGQVKQSSLVVADEQYAEAQRALLRILDEPGRSSGPDRLAAGLLLLFGVLPSRLVRLRVDDFSLSSEGYSVRLGDFPVNLPSELNTAVQETLATRHSQRLLGPVAEHHWLFPGARAGHPLSTDAMSARLSKLGVPVRSSRRAALGGLAQHLPPAILAKLTGVSVGTAVAWTKAVSATSARYVGTK